LRVSNQICHAHVRKKLMVTKMAVATPLGTTIDRRLLIVAAIARMIVASIMIARKRLPAPAGSRRIGTCSGVVMVSSLIRRSAAERDT
jgi:hypothetical protein